MAKWLAGRSIDSRNAVQNSDYSISWTLILKKSRDFASKQEEYIEIELKHLSVNVILQNFRKAPPLLTEHIDADQLFLHLRALVHLEFDLAPIDARIGESHVLQVERRTAVDAEAVRVGGVQPRREGEDAVENGLAAAGHAVLLGPLDGARNQHLPRIHDIAFENN